MNMLFMAGNFCLKLSQSFFNAVIRYSNVPKEMKKGVIVTLFTVR